MRPLLVRIAPRSVKKGSRRAFAHLVPSHNEHMANDKFRKMKLRPKAKSQAAQVWDAPQSGVKRAGKRTASGRRRPEAE